MAKLSTGASYGDTNRQTSQRLVGAAEQTAVGGELARQQMAQAALQPAASPVNTFQQVGAPTLGGPVKFFAPPDLPPPGQDLANLAKSLGGFSSTLGEVGDFLAKKEEYDQKQAELDAQQISTALSTAFPGQQFAQVRDSLYRQAVAGDENARAQYEYLQGLNPLRLAWVQRTLARSVYRQSIATGLERWQQMSTVPGPDGKPVPVEQLKNGDPLLLQAWSGLLPTINDPVVAKEFEPQAYGLFQQLNAAQGRLVTKAEERQAFAAAQQTVRDILDPKMPTEQGMVTLAATLDGFRKAMGPEAYQKLIEGLPDMFYASQNLLSKSANNPELGQKIEDLLKKTVAGANGQTINDRLGDKGGDRLTVDIVKNQMQNQREWIANEQTTADQDAKVFVTDLVESQRLRTPGLSPVERRKLADEGRQLIVSTTPDPVKRASYLSAYNAQVAGIEEAFSKPRQRELEIQADAITYNPSLTAQQKQRQLDALVLQGMDPLSIQRYRSDVERDAKAEGIPDAKERERNITDQVKALTEFLKAGEGGLTVGERNEIAKYERDMRANIAQLDRAGQAKGLSPEQVRENVNKYFERMRTDFNNRVGDQRLQTLVPLIPSVDNYQTGGPAIRQRLTAAVTVTPILPEAVFLKELGDVYQNNTISPGMRQLIKDAGYAGRAGDFFKAQWKTLYRDGRQMPPEMLQRLDVINQNTLSFATPRAPVQVGASPRANYVNDVASILRGMVNQGINQTANTLIGGASAATREPTTGPIGVVNTAGNVFVNPVPAVNLVANKGGYASDTGLDIHGPEGTSVVAALPGRIVYAERGHSAQMGQSSSSKGYKDQHSVLVELDQPFTFNNKTIRYAWYSHLQGLDPAVAGRAGARIAAGQRLGEMGIANKVSHLHIGFVGDREQKVFLNYKEIRELFAGKTGSTTPAPRATTRSGGGMTGYSTYYTGSGGSDGVAGGPTANGERFDPRKKTAAVQWSLRGKYLNKWLLVEDLSTGKAVRVWANDTGQMGGTTSKVSREDPRIIDLSPAAFTELFGGLRAGKARIRVRIDKNQRRS